MVQYTILDLKRGIISIRRGEYSLLKLRLSVKLNNPDFKGYKKSGLMQLSILKFALMQLSE